LLYLLLPPKVRGGTEWVDAGEVNALQPKIPVERQNGRERFERAGGSESVAVHGLRRADGEPVRMRAKNGTDGGCFRRIVGLCAGAVGIDVADAFRIQASITDRRTHRPGGSVSRGLSDVTGVR